MIHFILQTYLASQGFWRFIKINAVSKSSYSPAISGKKGRKTQTHGENVLFTSIVINITAVLFKNYFNPAKAF